MSYWRNILEVAREERSQLIGAELAGELPVASPCESEPSLDGLQVVELDLVEISLSA